MSKTIITTPAAAAAIGPYSQAVACRGFLFTSGQLPINPASGKVEGDITAQTHQIMKSLIATVEQAGGSASDIIRTTIYLIDLNDYAAVNQVYSSYFNGAYPARATVEVKGLLANARLEIDAIAVLPAG